MEDLGSDMTNPKPLVSLRNTLKQLKNELKGMDVRMGVLQSQVTGALLREGPGTDETEWQSPYLTESDELPMTGTSTGERDGCTIS